MRSGGRGRRQRLVACTKEYVVLGENEGKRRSGSGNRSFLCAPARRARWGGRHGRFREKRNPAAGRCWRAGIHLDERSVYGFLGEAASRGSPPGPLDGQSGSGSVPPVADAPMQPGDQHRDAEEPQYISEPRRASMSDEKNGSCVLHQLFKSWGFRIFVQQRSQVISVRGKCRFAITSRNCVQCALGPCSVRCSEDGRRLGNYY